MEEEKPNIEHLNARSEIQKWMIKFADLAERAEQIPLSGILYTVAGVIEGGLDESFAKLCNDYIEACRKAHKESYFPVDPKKFN